MVEAQTHDQSNRVDANTTEARHAGRLGRGGRTGNGSSQASSFDEARGGTTSVRTSAIVREGEETTPTSEQQRPTSDAHDSETSARYRKYETSAANDGRIKLRNKRAMFTVQVRRERRYVTYKRVAKYRGRKEKRPHWRAANGREILARK